MTKTLALLLLLSALPVSAQEQTLLGSGPVQNGGYGALVTKFTTINGRFPGGMKNWPIDPKL